MIALSRSLSYADYLQCANCTKEYSLTTLQTYASCCNQPLTVHYEYMPGFFKEDLFFREKNMWRYFEMLPVLERKNIVSLGEGMTPLLPLENLSASYGFADLFIKDESLNPTGSFKARGLSMAVSKARELGVERCIIPTAGNAGGALAAYCAKAGIECTVVMPRHTPEIFKKECEILGAELILVEGLINDCARMVALLKQKKDYFDMSTLKEPYRLEGKKTMGYEIAEQLSWSLPDVVIYPAGGGTGLIGIWKAFNEMLNMGWVRGPLPKMIAVQAENCAPIVKAFYDPSNWKEKFMFSSSIANGLAVPFPFGMNMIQQVLNHSGGTVLAVSDEEIVEGVKEISRLEGIMVAPEGAATWKALLRLRDQGFIDSSEKIVLLNTGTGYKYLQNLV